ncbi:uncharacterized protein [Penaeus vannamei]|uniref:uncharacterized protein n=1 Tax=Penaeus vannamei TaxID=6689 RepID=UPI00387FA364
MAHVNSNRDLHPSLVLRAQNLVRRDKEQFIKNIAEEVEGHFLPNDLHPAYQSLRKLNSNPSYLLSGCWSWCKNCCNPCTYPSVKIPLTLTEVRVVISKLKGTKAAGICNIPAELLKAGVEPMAWGLHVVLAGSNKDQSNRIHSWQVYNIPYPAWVCMDWIMERATFQSHCGATLGNIKGMDFEFVVVVDILSGSLESLVVALDAFSNEAKPLGLLVFWTKTKIQEFRAC